MEGRWKQARERTERAQKILTEQCTGVAWELGIAHLYSLFALLFLGELDEISRRLPRVLKDARDRGDIWATANLCNLIAHEMWLYADNPAAAQQAVEEAMKPWSRQSLHMQHWFSLWARTQIALYVGEGLTAWDRLAAELPAMWRSRHALHAQLNAVLAWHLHARSALAAAMANVPRQAHENISVLLRAAERDAQAIERERLLWGNPLARLIRAGISATRGKPEEAIMHLVNAEAGFQAADMALYEAVARRRRGELMGGHQGRTLIESANDWMIGQSIKSPDRVMAMLAPGRWLIV